MFMPRLQIQFHCLSSCSTLCVLHPGLAIRGQFNNRPTSRSWILYSIFYVYLLSAKTNNFPQRQNGTSHFKGSNQKFECQTYSKYKWIMLWGFILCKLHLDWDQEDWDPVPVQGIRSTQYSHTASRFRLGSCFQRILKYLQHQSRSRDTVCFPFLNCKQMNFVHFSIILVDQRQVLLQSGFTN